ncbi:(d)CMP kinase [Jatrophihabitans telluris]|uniref:Cytidylate kinase n=1 Tax=Jatrophihabitans telluris TaxID=2038343 RepID=A0ABY4R404_9ACTN|nr:(d)CMP kinase [Jatrophihabitans telluris]UQX90127.1 (d)CMP kinase [Jatrophihabitans telluris]
MAQSFFTGVVALDGPSGTGKSTVARQLAQRLGAQYLDTGAMYRAATVAVLKAGVDPADAAAVASTVSRIDLRVSTDPVQPSTVLNGVPIDEEIRSPQTTAAVSAVSAVAAVRTQLVAQQRDLINTGPTVAEGRDIASVVWPTAEVKVYLTASEQVRAARRAGELDGASVDSVRADLRRRDVLDASRATSPLRRADGALELDTSALSIDEVVTELYELAEQAARVSAGG